MKEIWEPHVTVAAIVEREQHYLMVEEYCSGVIRFNHPAGHLEDGESFIEAVIREVREETTFLFQPEAIVGYYRWRDVGKQRTHLRMAFCGTVNDERPEQVLDQGIIATHWICYDDIVKHPALRSPLVVRCIEDYRAGRRYPLDILRDVESLDSQQ